MQGKGRNLNCLYDYACNGVKLKQINVTKQSKVSKTVFLFRFKIQHVTFKKERELIAFNEPFPALRCGTSSNGV